MVILIADDDRRVRELVERVVTEMGHVWLSATTGAEAVWMAVTHRPAVIMTDGLMPRLHGFEVARMIRSISRRYVPRVVLMTAIYSRNTYLNDAKLKYGIDRCLVKPVTTEKVIEAITGTYSWYSFAITDDLMDEVRRVGKSA